ncbi:MAG: bacterial/archaeal transporter family-2 protein [Thermomicrobiales bacterium]|jgi:transporter family-2 protein|nr:bacterial/archaeal transporter family-2 protein [Thermomicrobiales bacterium]MEA2598835.1 bacterial/archaeal transporter family-2 protein [Thermomicrobiales bacterium]
MLALYMIVAVGMGCFLALQAGVNGRLRVRTGDPVHAALFSSAIAALSLLIYAVMIVRKPWPDPAEMASAPFWIWTGGLMGAAYVVTSLVLITRLGGAVSFALIVVGQMLASLIMDHFGLLGLPRHEVNPWRVLGAAFLVAGVVLIRRF